MKLTLPKPPSVNTLYKTTCLNGYPNVYMSQKGKDYYKMCGYLVNQQLRLKKPLQGDISLYIKLYVCGRYDWDNCLKVTNDLLTKSGVIEDDSQVMFGQVEKIKVAHRIDEAIEIEIVNDKP